jgi:L-asparaginase
MITILTTGGTFDKVYFDALSEFSIGEPMVNSIMEEGNVDIAFDVESILKKDSLDLTDEDRQLICDKVKTCQHKKIIITHGTDGMVATAQKLRASDTSSKTIVLVGAMQPARMRSTDAPFNLGFALASTQLLDEGIYIAMNGQIFSPEEVVKNREAGKFEFAK